MPSYSLPDLECGTEQMSSQTRQPLGAWQLEQCRLTAFLHPVLRQPSEGAWEQFTGSPPERLTKEPRAVTVREEGLFRGGVLVAESRPDRIDFVHQFFPSGAESLPSLPVIGPYPEVSAVFLQRCEAWLAAYGADLRRLALGTAALLPTSDRRTGYEQLSAYLPFPLDADAQDFSYQINRRKTLTCAPEITINRLARWSVWGIYASVPVIGGAFANIGDPVYVSRVELDVNTASETKTDVTKNLCGPVLRELASATREIIEFGDRR